LDRWALHRLSELILRVRKSYEDFEFHTIFHALNNFCSVDLSAVYLDILKDRLYTFRADSPLRRGSQTVLFEIVVAMTKLMAPVFSFTAEEIWRNLPEVLRKEPISVHLASFPESSPKWADEKLAVRWERLLYVRTVVQGGLEIRRREKLIGAPLEAHVQLVATGESYEILKASELSTLFIVSQVELELVPTIPTEGMWLSEPGAGFAVKNIVKAAGLKCERCWNYREAVGKDATHPTLCDRCVEAVR
jgi:isoleucyl-tRNA synthetase